MINDFINETKTWLSKPYDDNMNAFHWLLFIGFMISLTILWTRVIRRILV